ncbi:MAG: DUF6134 family protein [Gammaproteobacteria bacterium]
MSAPASYASAAALLLLALSLPLPGLAAQTLDFRVYLGERPIGTHRFEVRHDPQGYRVRSEASFSVRVLMFEAFRYEHRSEELWQRGCLHAIDARTDSGDERYFVAGRSTDGTLALETHAGSARLDGCVMTFAYWNPAILNAGRLLNAQTGEYLDVEVVALGTRRLSARGAEVEARGYRLRTTAADIDVWYSPDDALLALESTTERGDRLRYAAQ